MFHACVAALIIINKRREKLDGVHFATPTFFHLQVVAKYQERSLGSDEGQ
jgi:hypothetical protein